MVLYDSPGCWKCVEVREALDRLGLAYTAVRVAHDPGARADIERWTGALQVPVLRDGDVVVWDRRRILRHLEDRYGPRGRPPAPDLPAWMGGVRRVTPEDG